MLIIAKIVACLFFSKCIQDNGLNGWGNRMACCMYQNEKMACLIINRG